MCGVSCTLLHPGGQAIPASGRNPAQDGGPHEGLGPVGTPTQAMTSDSAWPLHRAPGSIKHGQILRVGEELRSVVFGVGVLHAECSCFLTPPTSRLDESPPAWSRLLLHPCPLDSAFLHSSSSFGTRSPHMRLWPEQRDYCRVPHHRASLPRNPQVPKTITSTPPSLAAKVPFHWGFFFCECV